MCLREDQPSVRTRLLRAVLLRHKGRKWFVSKEEDFAVYVGFDREPLKVAEGWSDVLPGLSVAENHGSRVLGLLEPGAGF